LNARRRAGKRHLVVGIYYGEKGEAAAEEALAQRAAGTPQISRLTPPQIDRLEQAIQSSIYDDEMLLNDCRHLTNQAEEIPKQVHDD
jgi:hypothetical protein